MPRARHLALCLLVAACSSPSSSPSSHHSPEPEKDAGTPDASPCDRKEDPIPKPAIHTPRWAFEPWISKDISTGPDTYAFVQGFLDRDIPVGAVVLDSPWETNYNTFVPNPTRYPDFAKMVGDMHGKGVKVVLWITQMVNQSSYDFETGGDSYPEPSPNYQEGVDCNYFVDDGRLWSWWKGQGGALDFLNPSAVAWWHAQQDAVLDTGIDGWKLDFGDTYVEEDPVITKAGPVPHQQYSEAYYHDYYAYGVHRRGKDFVTMVRAYDRSYGFEGRFHAKREDAPVCWMGDNRRDWLGLVDVLDEMFRSAKAGYPVLGSDVGGYLDKDDENLLGPTIPLDPVVFARWTALGGLSPFMQLHGRANITPWTFPDLPDQITAIYRYWAKLHHELVPFFYSAAEEAWAGGANLVEPQGDESAWPGDYRFLLGGSLLVAPLLDATGKRDVALPAGRWFDWWAPAADALAGGQTLAAYDATDLMRIPLFVRAGAIVPMEVGDDATGHGTKASAGKLTLLVYPDATASSLSLHETDDVVTKIDASSGAAGFHVGLSRALRDTLVRVRVEVEPAGVKVDGKASGKLADRAAFDAAAEGWFYEAATRSAWVKVPAGMGARTVEGS